MSVTSTVSPPGRSDPFAGHAFTVIIAILILAAVVLRLLGLDRSLSVDEAYTVQMAAAPGLRATSVLCGPGLLALGFFAFQKKTTSAAGAGAGVAYRDDHYFRYFRGVLGEASAGVARHHGPPALAWKNPELVLLIAGSAP